ncbi:MAG: cobamide remodeling phosphodiesterase CbiR [Dissulfuribacterales bacterium]
MHPPLPKSYKGLYPFKLGTTSYIYPAGYTRNVKMLAPYVDEIELLLFESAPDSLPSNHEIKKLLSLSKEFDLTYNVHLPTDISLSDPDPSIRHAAVETLKKVMDITTSLCPSTYTLHLSYDEKKSGPPNIKNWQERVYSSVKQFIATGINPEMISIETLTYSMEWVESILNDFNLSVCIDLGHLMLYGLDMETVFSRYHHRTSIIHLHGVENRKDHLSLDRLSKEKLVSVMEILKRFNGVVSLEVFSYSHLKDSLQFLEKLWYNRPA